MPISRHDGRQTHESRPPKITFEALSRVDGSARFSFGSTGPSALSSVSGPIEVRLAAENASQATFDVLVRPLSNVPATEAKALGAAVKGLLAPSLILWQNPRTMVQVVAQAMTATVSAGPGLGDGLVAAIINASTLAILNAGSMPMQGVVCAVAVGRRRGDRLLIVDPDEKEEAVGKVLDIHGCFAFMFAGKEHTGKKESRGRCVWTNWRTVVKGGDVFDEKVLREARNLAAEAAERVYAAIFRSLSGDKNEIKEDVIEREDRDSEDDDDKMEI